MMYLLLLLLCLSTQLLSIHAAPKAPLAYRDASGPDQPPNGVPALIYPNGADDMLCPVQYTNLFYQGIQKRTLQPQNDMGKLPTQTPALQSRAIGNCENIAHFSWTGFTLLQGNTQDVFLWGGSNYLFSVSASVPIVNAYAWIAGSGTDNYTTLATGGNGGKTATVAFNLTEGGGHHIHFEAVSKEVLSSGLAAVFKQSS